VLLERRDVRLEACENQAAIGFDSRQLEQAFRFFEVLGIAALLASMREPDQLAVVLIDPAMIGAFELARIAMHLAAQNRAPMYAPVYQHGNIAVVVARHEHGLHADVARLVVPGVGQLGRMCHEYPGPLEDEVHLGLEHVRVGVSPRMHSECMRRFRHKTAKGSLILADIAAELLQHHAGLHPFAHTLPACICHAVWHGRRAVLARLYRHDPNP
jgi:hypothetical protein